MNVTLNLETEQRLRRVAEARGKSPDALMRDAVEQYLEREDRIAQAGQHPSGKPWPQRHPVGGIIAPV